MKVSVTNTKGGVGKTTTAIMLASVLAEAGRSVEVWDADPQGSATRWFTDAAENGEPLLFDVVAVNQLTVRRPVPAGIDVVLVDTSPNAPGINQAAVESSDLVIVPTITSPDDVARTWMTLDVAEFVRVPTRVLITQAEMHTVAFREAVAGLRAGSAPLLRQTIPKAVRLRDEAVRRPRAFFGYEFVAKELGLLV